jgi:tRNA-uridine 2-sulfurtransferase
MSLLKKKVLLGLSGGVDSAISAYLLQKEYDVTAAFMQNWNSNDPYCTSNDDLSDARSVCLALNIPLLELNFSTEYWDSVFQFCLQQLQLGLTPNPDILCNKYIKFKAFLDHALTLNFDYIAMGHFAEVKKIDGSYRLFKGRDDTKDQSYFLCQLTQAQLKKVIFPLGKWKKSEVRALAKNLDFINHDKKDSTGLCFIGEQKFSLFISKFLLDKPGVIKDLSSGETMGEHRGLFYYTIGQRKGLGIGGAGEPWFVSRKDIENNILWVIQGDQIALHRDSVDIKNLHWISGSFPVFPFSCKVKTRYRQEDQDCIIHKINESFRVVFTKKQKALTPGQYAVFYLQEECVGSGIIQDLQIKIS